MIQLTRGQEVKIKLQRQLSEELKRRKLLIFPNCIRYFPDEDCQNTTPTKLGKSCRICPYFNEVNYMSIIKQLEPKEYSEDRKKAMKEIEFKLKEKTQLNSQFGIDSIRKISKKRTGNIAGDITKIAIDMNIKNENEIYNILKVNYNDKTEEYLRKRIRVHINWLKKESKI